MKSWLLLIIHAAALSSLPACAPAPVREPAAVIYEDMRPPWKHRRGTAEWVSSTRTYGRTASGMRGFNKMARKGTGTEPYWSDIFQRKILGADILDPYGENALDWVGRGSSRFEGVPACATFENRGVLYVTPKGAPVPRDRIQYRVSETRMDLTFSGELWEYGGRRFRLVNIGGRAKAVDQPIVDALYAGAPLVDQPFSFAPYGAKAFKSAADSRLQRVMMDGVVHEYAKEYPESEHDILTAYLGDGRSDATDFLVLIEDGPYDLATLSREEIFKRAVVTVQLHRDCIELHDLPTVLFKEKGLVHPGQDPLAFERRLSLKDSSGLNVRTMAQYRKLKGRRIVAEVTRYARFNRFPRPLRDALWARIFELALEQPHRGDMLVYSVGEKMDRALKDLRFKDVGLIQTLHEQPERLKYLYTDSNRFKRTLARLRVSSAQVVRRMRQPHERVEVPVDFRQRIMPDDQEFYDSSSTPDPRASSDSAPTGDDAP